MKPKKLKRVVIKEELVALTGNYITALILNQFIYWSERTEDTDKFLEEERTRNPDLDIELLHGWVFKKSDDLNEELMLGINATTLRRYITKLIDLKLLLQRHNPYHKYDRTLQYRPNIVEIQRQLHFLGYALEGYPLYLALEANLHFAGSNLQNADSNLQNAGSNLQNADSNLQNAAAIPEITLEITPDTSFPLTPQGELKEEKCIEPEQPEQQASTLTAPLCLVNLQLETLNSQIIPNKDQAQYSSLDDDKTLGMKNLKNARLLKSVRRKSRENGEVGKQQDTERSLKYTVKISSASTDSTDSNAYPKLPLPLWRNSALANDYHEGFVDYLATQHLPHCSVYRQSGKQPTKGDAKNWILAREAKDEQAQIQNKWEDYQALNAKSDISKPEKQRELTVWEKQMRSQYEEEGSGNPQPERLPTSQELIAQIEANKTKRRHRGWLKHQNQAM